MNTNKITALYKTAIFSKETGFDIHAKLPPGWKRLVEHFYEQGRRETMEELVKEMQEYSDKREDCLNIRLTWDEQRGLTNISLSAHAGVDLDTKNPHMPRLRGHNIGHDNFIYGHTLAKSYVHQLLLSTPPGEKSTP